MITGLNLSKGKSRLQELYDEQSDEENQDPNNRYFNTSTMQQFEIQAVADSVAEKIEEAKEDILEYASSVTSANNIVSGFQLIASEIYNAFAKSHNSIIEDRIENMELSKEFLEYSASLSDLQEKVDEFDVKISDSYDNLINSVVSSLKAKGDDENASLLESINSVMNNNEKEHLAKNIEEFVTTSSDDIYNRLEEFVEEDERIKQIKAEQKTAKSDMTQALSQEQRLRR